MRYEGMHGDERKAASWSRVFHNKMVEYLERGNYVGAEICRACCAENERVLRFRFKWSRERLQWLYGE